MKKSKNKIKLSLIVPVYNVEEYLVQCLESLTKQTLEELEIIIVNDCSPDSSEKIIKKFLRQDSRITYLVHEANKGHGGALNTGLKHARGQYVWMIDSDDFIDHYACEFLYNYIKDKKCDALALSANDYEIRKKQNIFVNNRQYSYPQAMIDRCYSGMDFFYNSYIHFNCLITPPWGYLFKRSLFKSFAFRENVSFEDTDAIVMLLNKIQSIAVLKFSPYYRLIHQANSVSFLRDKNVVISEKQIMQRIAIVETLLNYISKQKIIAHSIVVVFAVRFFYKNILVEARRYIQQQDACLSVSEHLTSLKREFKRLFGITSFENYLLKYFRFDIFFALVFRKLRKKNF